MRVLTHGVEGRRSGPAGRVGKWRCIGLVALLLCVVLGPGCVVPGRGGPPKHRDGHVVSDPAAWQRANAPLVEEYLATLPDSQKGQLLGGILLSDGTRWFEGYRYLGKPQTDHVGLQVRMLRDQRGRVLAYMRLDEGSEPLPLQPCKGKENPGIRARQLTGEVYAWYALAPDQGFVYTACPPEAWLSQLGLDWAEEAGS
jgi:hypothetical protein